MIRRDVTITVPRARDDGRRWVAAQLEVPDGDGWRSVQAVTVPRTLGRRGRMTVPLVTPDDARRFRVVWVPDGGSGAGLLTTPPVELED